MPKVRGSWCACAYLAAVTCHAFDVWGIFWSCRALYCVLVPTPPFILALQWLYQSHHPSPLECRPMYHCC